MNHERHPTFPARHLARDGYWYVRPVTRGDVSQHTSRLQWPYSLQAEAAARGWPCDPADSRDRLPLAWDQAIPARKSVQLAPQHKEALT